LDYFTFDQCLETKGSD